MRMDRGILMPVRDGREYRDIEIGEFEARPDSYVVEGYATVFDAPYAFGRGANEVISSHALDGADMSDVIFQYDHSGRVLARRRNGTLDVVPDSHGLRVRADLGGSEDGRRLYESIKNGLVDRMSWGFTVADGGWEWDPATSTSTVTKVDKVYDVSAVSIPACDATVIYARSYLDGVIEARKLQELQEREAVRVRAAVRLNFAR